MADARRTENWNHTSQILAMSFNLNRGKGVTALKPADFHPYAPPAPPAAKISMTAFREMFQGKQAVLEPRDEPRP